MSFGALWIHLWTVDYKLEQDFASPLEGTPCKTNKKTPLLPSLPAQLGAADSLKMYLQRTHKEAFSSHILACACHAPVISSRASAANLQVDTGWETGH